MKSKEYSIQLESVKGTRYRTEIMFINKNDDIAGYGESITTSRIFNNKTTIRKIILYNKNREVGTRILPKRIKVNKGDNVIVDWGTIIVKSLR